MAQEPVQAATKSSDQELFLSEVLSIPALAGTKKIGTLADLVIVETGKIPEVRQICIHRPFGNPSLLVPWERVASIGRDAVVLDTADIRPFEAEPPADALLLKDYVLDKKVIDLEESEVEVVYDIRLVLKNRRLYVTDVDTGRVARLRRLGLKPLSKLIYTPDDERNEQRIPWIYIQPLPPNIGSFRGDVKLNVLKEKLADMHPVDLADIIEELDHEQRLVVFASLDSEQASDTLEEIEPNVQRDLIPALPKERIVILLSDMTPGQAADVLSVLPSSDAHEILEALGKDLAKKIAAIMEKQEEKVIHYTTQKFLKFSPDTTVEYVQNDYPRHARGKAVIMYVYVTDSEEHLLGVIDLKELLQADDRALLKDIMVESVISLSEESTLKEASQQFARYDFRALPVTDANNRLLGVIPYRDVMNLTHHFLE